ncbi:hypothetical protein LGM71_31565 [Burkholderia sp. AU33545]|uniref:hypothetical protein n=1 Tax=Burkholderia sp. AU33545 TaxID=2879631 RepID=UPI001CF4A2C6|nr:hypothetical protein [Burkholderia sp. AU33545]MCA8205570.1 hypothetical protein [Burkholderia sp. AU33545]
MTYQHEDPQCPIGTAEDEVIQRCADATIAAQCGRAITTVAGNRNACAVRDLSASDRAALLAQVSSAMLSLSNIRTLLLT